MRRITGIFGSALIALLVATPRSASALWEDRLEVFASERVTYDNNVFRVSDRVDPNAAIGSPTLSDTIFTTALGFSLDVPWSLQRLQLGYTWYDQRYRRFKDVDHRGHVARAAYLWSITPRLTGDIGYDEREGLASFANIQGRRPDLVTTRMAYANGAWLMTPSWRLHSALTHAEAEHTDARTLTDLEANAAEVGLSYVSKQENRIGIAVRGERGRSPDEILLFGLPFDNEYKQQSVGVQGRWVVTGLSRFDGRLDYTRREYEQLTQRNYSGPTFSLTYTYTPTGKLTIATTAQRDIAPLEDITTSFVMVSSLAIRPDWAISDKLNLRGHLAYAKWDYSGDPLLGQDFEHRVRSAGISLLYRPARRISITTGLTREHRTSTLANADYKVDTATVEARIGF